MSSCGATPSAFASRSRRASRLSARHESAAHHGHGPASSAVRTSYPKHLTLAPGVIPAARSCVTAFRRRVGSAARHSRGITPGECIATPVKWLARSGRNSSRSGVVVVGSPSRPGRGAQDGVLTVRRIRISGGRCWRSGNAGRSELVRGVESRWARRTWFLS
jgi:hypothetical protein